MFTAISSPTLNNTCMNRVVHFEIHASDMDRISDFYMSVFGWQINDMGEKYGNYRTVTTGEDKPGDQWRGINGGITPRRGSPPAGSEPVDAFVCTISVDDIDEYIGKVKAAGGSIALDKMDVPNVGLLAYCKDPENNIFGILQPHMGAQ